MKPPKSWQDKQWYPEERSNIDLSSRLQALESQKYPQLAEWQGKGQVAFKQSLKLALIIGLILIIGKGLFSIVSLPWHWQLFSHWLQRKGELQEIPVSLYQELNRLCLNADKNGQVDGYNASREVAYGLGHFQCLPTQDNKGWVIRDKYAFNDSAEALAGTQLAEFLINVWGSDYTYDIRATIPKVTQNWTIIDL